MEPDNKGAKDLPNILGDATSVAGIWLGITLVDIYCSARAESCGSGKILFARHQRLIEIFGGGSCCFGIFGSGLTLVEGVNDFDWSPREYIPYGYLGIR